MTIDEDEEPTLENLKKLREWNAKMAHEYSWKSHFYTVAAQRYQDRITKLLEEKDQ